VHRVASNPSVQSYEYSEENIADLKKHRLMNVGSEVTESHSRLCFRHTQVPEDGSMKLLDPLDQIEIGYFTLC
jgi:hypothetical protein